MIMRFWILILFVEVSWVAQSWTDVTSSASYEYSTEAVSTSTSESDSNHQYFPDSQIVLDTASDSNHQQYFPDSQMVLDMAILSGSVYQLMDKEVSCHDHSSTKKLVLPSGAECLHYSHDLVLGTQVLVVRSTLHNFVAISYAGTNDLTTFSTDGNALLSDFGPTQTILDDENMSNNSSDNDFMSIFKNLPEGVGVHRGFNNAVFNSDFFPVMLRCIASARLGGACCNEDDGGCSEREEDEIMIISNSTAPYQLYTTGHSLGAANAVLLGAALHLAYPNENIRSVNFGCPKIGANPWKDWVNSLQPDRISASSGSYEIFRFVNKLDVIPRQPRFVLAHAGHTLQMTVGGVIQVSCG